MNFKGFIYGIPKVVRIDNACYNLDFALIASYRIDGL